MAVTDAYATGPEYKAIAKTLGAAGDTGLEEDLEAMTRVIEVQAGQFFTRDASTVARIYDPEISGRLLRVDNIATLTGVSIKVDRDRDGSFSDETAFALTDYQLRRFGDLNPDKGPEAMPWNEIYIPSWSAQAVFEPGAQVEVTASFGWPAVPATVKKLCIELTRLWRLEGPRAANRFNDMNEMLTNSREARTLLHTALRAYSPAVVA